VSGLIEGCRSVPTTDRDEDVAMQGFFDLRTPPDLFGKLGRDFARMNEEPLSSDCAFNFFVTADHIVDWLHPGDRAKDTRSAKRGGSILLQICYHLSSGAKHFEATHKCHTSVAKTERHRGAFGPGFSKAFDISRLEVHLDGDAAKTYGESIDALDLAQHVYDYWKRELGA
jgi:hypothetical protein